MYWDVVEVKPEPGYCLFVRFQDGLSGHVRLQLESIISKPAPVPQVPQEPTNEQKPADALVQ
jgi:hypothetical protein